jgi:hypothetical protein
LNHLNVGLNRTNSKNFSDNIGAKPSLSSVAPNFYGNSFPDVCWDGLDSYSCWVWATTATISITASGPTIL